MRQLIGVSEGLSDGKLMCATSSMVSRFDHCSRRCSLFGFVRKVVIGLGRGKGVEATRACGTALGDFGGFERSRSVVLSDLGSRMVRTCRT